MTANALREAAAVTALAAVVAAMFFHTLLFGSGVFASVDMVKVHVPFRHFISESFAAGQLPLWVPHLYLGTPFLANGDAAVLYPLQIPLLLTDPARGMGWVIWLHASLAIATMYAFARLSLRVSPISAFTGGVAFAFNGYALSHTLYLSEIYLAPWPPLVFLAVERTLRARPAWGWLIPPAVALTVLSGNPQEMYWSGLWLPVLVAAIAVAQRRSGLLVRGLAVLAAGTAPGLAMAAAQLLPQADLVRSTSRGGAGFSFAQATLFPVTKRIFATLPLPDYMGWFFGENAAWVGTVALLLVLPSVLAFRSRDARPMAVFLWVMAVGSAILALGATTPAYRVLYDVLPGMHSFRFPVRWLYPASLALAGLTAVGAEEIVRLAASRLRRSRQRDYLAAACSAIIVGLLLVSPLGGRLVATWSRHEQLWSASLVALLVAGLALALAMTVRRVGRAALVFVPAAVVIELFGVSQFMSWNHPVASDYYSRSRPLPAALTEAGSATGIRVLPLARSTAWQDALDRLGPNTNLLIDRGSVYGNGGNWPAGRSIALEQDVVLPAIANPDPTHRLDLWRALSVTHVVVAARDAPLFRPPDFHLVAHTPAFALFAVTRTLPRARIACSATAETSAGAALSGFLSASYRADELLVEGAHAGGAAGASCGSTSVIRDTPDVETIDVRVDSPSAYLVLADSYDASWQASVDGNHETVFPADYFLRAVVVSRGRHVVRFTYEPYAFRLGLPLSLASTLVWLIGALVALRRARRFSSSGRSPRRGST